MTNTMLGRLLDNMELALYDIHKRLHISEIENSLVVVEISQEMQGIFENEN